MCSCSLTMASSEKSYIERISAMTTLFVFLYAFVINKYLQIKYFVMKYSREIRWGVIQNNHRFMRFLWTLDTWDTSIRWAIYYICLDSLYYFMRAHTPKDQWVVDEEGSISACTIGIGKTWFSVTQGTIDSGDCYYSLNWKAETLAEADDISTNKTIMDLYSEFNSTLAMNEEAQTLINRMDNDQLTRNHYSQNNMGFTWYVWSYYYAALTAYRKVICKKTIKDIQQYNLEVKEHEDCHCPGCMNHRSLMQAMTIVEAGIDTAPWANRLVEQDVLGLVDTQCVGYMPLDVVLANMVAQGVATLVPGGVEPTLCKMTPTEQDLVNAINEGGPAVNLSLVLTDMGLPNKPVFPMSKLEKDLVDALNEVLEFVPLPASK